MELTQERSANLQLGFGSVLHFLNQTISQLVVLLPLSICNCGWKMVVIGQLGPSISWAPGLPCRTHSLIPSIEQAPNNQSHSQHQTSQRSMPSRSFNGCQDNGQKMASTHHK
jgi:hypothetical protein